MAELFEPERDFDNEMSDIETSADRLRKRIDEMVGHAQRYPHHRKEVRHRIGHLIAESFGRRKPDS